MEEQSTRAEYRCRSIVGNGAGAGEGATNERSSNGAEGRMHGNVRGENEVEELKSGNNNNNNSSSSFDCNICLESATDPVVTLCGHLFCWPCIYQWVRASHACPVCKAATKEGTLIPLYGGGSAKAGPRNIGIPNRPTHTRTPTPTPTPVIHSYPSPGDYMSHQPYPYPSPSFNHYGLSTGLPPAGYELSPFFAFQCSSVGPSLPHNRHHEAFLEKLFAFVLCFVFVCLISF